MGDSSVETAVYRQLRRVRVLTFTNKSQVYVPPLVLLPALLNIVDLTTDRGVLSSDLNQKQILTKPPLPTQRYTRLSSPGLKHFFEYLGLDIAH